VIDVKDTAFNDLRVWVDANGDGVTDAKELHTLADVGVKSINLQHADVWVTQSGNSLAGQGSFTKTDGTQGALSDAWFSVKDVVTLDLNQVATTLDAQGLTHVDLMGAQPQTLKLDLKDVLGQNQSTLIVNGNGQDVVDLTQLTQWSHQANTVEQAGHVYDVYTQGQAHLLIEHQVLVHAAG
jgi:hypothetical protein